MSRVKGSRKHKPRRPREGASGRAEAERIREHRGIDIEQHLDVVLDGQEQLIDVSRTVDSLRKRIALQLGWA